MAIAAKHSSITVNFSALPDLCEEQGFCLWLNERVPVQMGPLYLAAMDAIYATPNGTDTLFFVEGTGQTAFPGLNWGDGFITNNTLIQQYGLSDPNPFFQTLLTKPYLNNVGVGPHIYPPSVTYATQVWIPPNHCRFQIVFWHACCTTLNPAPDIGFLVM